MYMYKYLYIAQTARRADNWDSQKLWIAGQGG